MSTLAEIEAAADTLTMGEKAALLQKVARDIGHYFPGIDNTPAVCGGEACISRTRIPVWVLVRAQQLGLNESEILRSFPTLRAEDLANAWSYHRGHRAEIERAIAENETD